MATKIEITGQSLVITDTVTSKVIFDAPKSNVYYDNDLLISEGIIDIKNIDLANKGYVSAPRIFLPDAVDSGDSSFTESAFISFARNNLGFKLAGSTAQTTRDYINRVLADGGFVDTTELVSRIGTIGDESLALIPSAYKVGTLYNVLPDSPPADFTVDRNSIKTRVDSDGLIEEIAIDVPSIDYTDGDGVLLLEPQSTNLLLRSEEFDDASWNKSNTTILLDANLSPDGNSFFNLKAISDNGNIRSTTITVNSNQDYIYTIYAEKKDNNFLRIRLFGFDTDISVWFDLENGVVGSDISGVGSISLFKGNIYRCSIILNTTTDLTGEIWMYPSATNTAGSLIGDNINIWGAQLEQLPYSTSYIKTEGSTVTRLEDQVTDAGDVNTFNSEEGVLYIEMAALFDSGIRKEISINDGTTSNIIIIRYGTGSNQIQVLVIVNSTIVALLDKTVSDGTSFTKIGVKWKENDFALWVNGVEEGTDNSGVSFSSDTLDILEFEGANFNRFFGKIKSLKVFKTALTDAQLEALTTNGFI